MYSCATRLAVNASRVAIVQRPCDKRTTLTRHTPSSLFLIIYNSFLTANPWFQCLVFPTPPPQIFISRLWSFVFSLSTRPFSTRYLQPLSSLLLANLEPLCFEGLQPLRHQFVASVEVTKLAPTELQLPRLTITRLRCESTILYKLTLAAAHGSPTDRMKATRVQECTQESAQHAAVDERL